MHTEKGQKLTRGWGSAQRVTKLPQESKWFYYLFGKCDWWLNNCWQIDRIKHFIFFFFVICLNTGAEYLWQAIWIRRFLKISQIKTVNLEFTALTQTPREPNANNTVVLAVVKGLKTFTRNGRPFLCWCILNFQILESKKKSYYLLVSSTGSLIIWGQAFTVGLKSQRSSPW